MSIQFTWDNTYSVGSPDLDEQHRRMFELANSLAEMTDEGRIKHTIWRMFKHVHEHFAHEENMMKEIGYTQLNEHRELHNELITKLSDISTRTFDSQESLFQFQKFIYDWIINHIMIADKDYFLFAQGQRPKTSG